MSKNKKSVIEIAGCETCAYFSAAGNCWLYGMDRDSLNKNPYMHRDPLKGGGSFRLSEGCPSHEGRRAYTLRKKAEAKKPPVKVFLGDSSGSITKEIGTLPHEEAKAVVRRATAEHKWVHMNEGKLVVGDASLV